MPKKLLQRIPIDLPPKLVADLDEHCAVNRMTKRDVIAKALVAYIERHRKRNPYEMTGTEQKLMGKYLPKLLKTDGDLVIPQGAWNDVIHAPQKSSCLCPAPCQVVNFLYEKPVRPLWHRHFHARKDGPRGRA